MPFHLGGMRESREDPCATGQLKSPSSASTKESFALGGAARGPALCRGRLGGGGLATRESFGQCSEGLLVALDTVQDSDVLLGELQVDGDLVADERGLGRLGARDGVRQGL